ncbi:MAG: ECF-type sigma factor [Acidobacteriota bacterium]
MTGTVETPPTTDPADTTALLRAWSAGDAEARDVLVRSLYDELRTMAHRRLRSERSDHTLSPTALAHETVLRLYRDLDLDWRDRRHFFAVTAGMMRRILVDHARRRGRAKRGGGHLVRLDDPDAIGAASAYDLVALDEALSALAAIDERKARIVDLHFFGGLSVVETASVLDCSESTVSRDWRMAKAWLLHHLGA